MHHYALHRPHQPPAQKIETTLQQKKQMEASSLVKNIPLKNIGPTVMSGRVVDVDVNPDEPNRILCGLRLGRIMVHQ